jgi:hypothetical protein
MVAAAITITLPRSLLRKFLAQVKARMTNILDLADLLQSKRISA